MNLLLLPLTDWLVKSLILLTLALAIAQCMRRSSAARRHLLLHCAFVALLMLPLTQLINPRWTYTWEKAEAPVVLPMMPAKMPVAMEVDTIPKLDAAPSAPAPLPKPVPRWHLPSWSTLLVGGWMVGVMVFLAHRLVGSVLLARLRRRSALVEDERIWALIDRVTEEMGVRAGIEIRQSELCCVPVTWGFRTHVLLLPVEALQWSDTKLLAAFRHEFGHISRHDYLTRLLATLTCALYWPNPLVWIAARSLRVAQEQACDDLVLRAGTPAEDYATLLFDAARNLVRVPLPARQAMAMAQPSTLETRITAIVDDRDRRVPGRGASLLAGFGMVSVVLACSSAQISHAAKPAITLAAVDTAPAAAKPATLRKAESLIIPRLDFRDATVKDVFDFLMKKSKELDPEKAGINFVLKLPASSAAPIAAIPGLESAGAAPDPARITLQLNNVPLSEAIRYIADQANLAPQFDEYAVTIAPKVVGEGAKDPAADSLTNAPSNAALQRKVNTLVIPKLDLKEATLRDSMEFLTRKSKELDPEKVGVNILFKLPEGAPNPRVTLTLNDVPLITAIQYIATISNVKFRVEPYAVYIVSADYVDELYTQTWKISPDLFSFPGAGGTDAKGAPGIGATNAKDALVQAGVVFPVGSVAVYSPATHSLTVKNTRENLDLVGRMAKLYEDTPESRQTAQLITAQKAKIEQLQLQLERVSKLKPEDVGSALRILEMDDSTVKEILPALALARGDEAQLLASGTDASDPKVKGLRAKMETYQTTLKTQLEGLQKAVGVRLEAEGRVLQGIQEKAQQRLEEKMRASAGN